MAAPVRISVCLLAVTSLFSQPTSADTTSVSLTQNQQRRLLAAVATTTQTSPPDCGGTFIAVKVFPEVVVLGTYAAPPANLWSKLFEPNDRWRFRGLPVVTGQAIRSAAISWDSTELHVTFDRGERTVDLTAPVYGLSPVTGGHPDQPASKTVSSDAPESKAVECVAPADNLLEDFREFAERSGFRQAAQDRSAEGWRFYEVAPNRARYAPLLQMAKEERILPSSFDIWTVLKKELRFDEDQAWVVSGAKLPRAYKEYRDPLLLRTYLQKNRDCTIYHAQPAPKHAPKGSWLLEYWFYYPFDLGGVGPHLHDSEHLFVEVDVLGGAVRRVIGAGHGIWAPNNIYHTFLPGAIPIALPLYAIVELGKHATAPDINHDGFFTPGIDSNNYWDAPKVWGVRDAVGTTDSNQRRYEGSMSIPRASHRAKFAIANDAVPYFESVNGHSLPEGTVRCDFVKLPEPVATKCEDGDLDLCAQREVWDHPDRKSPTNSLKTGYFPQIFARYEIGALPAPSDAPKGYRTGGASILTIGAEINRLGAPLPGRLAVDGYFTMNMKDFRGATIRYERLLANFLGSYLSFTVLRDMYDERDDDRKTTWLGGGIFLEQIFWKRIGLHASAGFIFDDHFGLNPQVSTGLSISLSAPFSTFGLRPGGANPY